jgi:UDP-N-acetylmuramyl tripeptide synthase
MQHAADAKHCRRCGAPYRYDAVYLGHLGRYHCDNCGATRPDPQVCAHDIVLEGVRGARFTLRTPAGARAIALPLPGLYNVYNALGAAALSLAFGATLDHVDAGLHAVSPAFGRAETLRIADRDMSILLVKNPAGANEVLRTLMLEDGEHDIFAVLNDNIADGRDVSWVWDADFEVLAPRVRRATCSGTRAAEMALRLKYAGVPTDRIAVEPELGAGLDRALRAGDGPLFALPTYTAMLALRDLLVARGAVRGSFT